MKAFLGWIGTICAVTAVCAVVHTLTPKNGTGKVLRLLSTAVIICTMLQPLRGFIKDFSLPQYTVEAIEEQALYDTTVTQIKTMTEGLLLSQVNTALASYDLHVEKVEISMDISEDGDISIRDIRLLIPEGNSLQSTWVAQIAEKRLGKAVTVEYTSGG